MTCAVGVQVAMRALGFDAKKADVLKILRDHDRDGSDKISYDDFYEVSKWQCAQLKGA